MWAFDVVAQRVYFGVMGYAHVRTNANASPIIKVTPEVNYRSFSHRDFSDMEEFAFAMYAALMANLDAEATQIVLA